MRQAPLDRPLGKQVRPFSSTFSALTVVKEMFFPSKEKPMSTETIIEGAGFGIGTEESGIEGNGG